MRSTHLTTLTRKIKPTSIGFPDAGWAIALFRMFRIIFDFVSLTSLESPTPNLLTWFQQWFPNAGWHNFSPGTPGIVGFLVICEFCLIDKLWWDTRLNDLDFAFTVDESGETTFLPPFRHHSLLSVRKKWLREHVVLLMMVNRCNRLFHSSRVKLPLVHMSASWLLVSTYLIWIFEPILILSNNQSNVTLWVLDACLIVGLLPLMIFITASLSFENVQLWFLFREMCVRRNLINAWQIKISIQHSTDLGCAFWWSCLAVSRGRLLALGNPWIVFDTFITKSHKSSAGKASIRKPASSDVISDSVELTLKFAFCSSNWLVQMFCFRKMHKNSPWCGCWVFKISCKIGVWK